MHKFMHLFYIVIIAVMGILLYTQQPAQIDSPVAADNTPTEQATINADPQTATSEPKAPGDNALRELEDEIERLQTLLAVQDDQTATNDHEESNNESSPAVASTDNDDFLDNEFITRMDARRDSILKRLEDEEKDTEWAYQTETAISDLFYTEDDLSNAELTEVECRTTVCKVIVSTEDPRLWATPSLLTSAIRNNANLRGAYTGLRTYQENNTIRVLIEKNRYTNEDESD